MYRRASIVNPLLRLPSFFYEKKNLNQFSGPYKYQYQPQIATIKKNHEVMKCLCGRTKRV